MSSFKSPAYNVKAVPVEKIVANSYNPNVVAPPEMKLLELSIWEDGYTMPLVCYENIRQDLQARERIAACNGHKQGHLEQDGLDYPS